VPRLGGEREDVGKERQKIDNYRALVDQVSHRISSNDLSTETLSLVTKVLVKNPEYYTIWNCRRRLIQSILAGNTANAKTTIVEELNFLVPLLMQFPKCYWIWNYRIWLLNLAEDDGITNDALQLLEGELGLVGKMLGRDARNFHGWDYRRHIITQIERLRGPNQPTMVQSEFEYTTKMIRKGLQNFSALHYRSKLIPRMLQEQGADASERRKLFERELDLMQEALIDPYNQSAWFYHAFLMDTLLPNHPPNERILQDVTLADRTHYFEQELNRIKEILEDFDDCKWVFQSLLHYCIEYSRNSGREPLASHSEMISWLDALMRLDPSRSGRWKDLRHAYPL
jgi:geranylgeranyl transferase type-2 subunit alpha